MDNHQGPVFNSNPSTLYPDRYIYMLSVGAAVCRLHDHLMEERLLKVETLGEHLDDKDNDPWNFFKNLERDHLPLVLASNVSALRDIQVLVDRGTGR